MVDIPALILLDERERAITDLPDPCDPSCTVEKFERQMKEYLDSTNKTIAKVANYVDTITEKLQKVGKSVLTSSINIGEKVQDLLSKLLVEEGKPPLKSGSRLTLTKSGNLQRDVKSGKRPNSNKKNLDQILALEKLAEQQRKLQESISKTQEVILKIAQGSDLTMADIDLLKNKVNDWMKTLESIEQKRNRLKQKEKQKEDREKEKKRKEDDEEQKRREEEERIKREEEESRRREEEERRRREEEERIREEEERQRREDEEKRRREEEEKRRREEEEKRRREEEERRRREEVEKWRRDWRNWPMFIYKNKRKNKFGQTLLCVILTMPNGIEKSDILCEGSDNVNELDCCLESNDETVLSSLVTIKPAPGNKIRFEMPIRVFVPITGHSSRLIPGVKFTKNLDDKNRFIFGKQVEEIRIDGEQVDLVGTEIDVDDLKQIQCIAVARFETENFKCNRNKLMYESNRDRNIQFNISDDTFSEESTISAKIIQRRHFVDSNSIRRKIQTVGPFLDVSTSNPTNKNVNVTMFESGFKRNSSQKSTRPIHTDVIEGLTGWLVNNMDSDFDESFLEEHFGSDFVDEYFAKSTTGDKIRFVLKKMHDLNSTDFNKFLKNEFSLKHPKIADKILSTLQSPISRENSINFGSDFEDVEGNTHIMSKVSGRQWEVATLTDFASDYPRRRVVQLPAGHNKYQIVGLILNEDMTDDDIRNTVVQLEQMIFGTSVSIICRQKHTNPFEVSIECVKTYNVPERMRYLESLGFSDGPPESSPIPVVDGDVILLQFEANLYLEGFKNTVFKIKFFNNLQSDKYSGNLMVVDKSDYSDTTRYRGYLKYSIPQSKVSYNTADRLVLYVPMPPENMVETFAFTLDAPVKVLAKFIAWQLTRNSDNNYKRQLYGGNLVNNKKVYSQITKYVDGRKTSAPQRERSEQFILYWASHIAKPNCDKVEKIIRAHNDAKSEDEARKFVKLYIPGKGILSNDYMERMAYIIVNDWEVIASKLGFTSNEINNFKVLHGGKIKQCLQMLDNWRCSSYAIEKGNDIMKCFQEAAKGLECYSSLNDFICELQEL